MQVRKIDILRKDYKVWRIYEIGLLEDNDVSNKLAIDPLILRAPQHPARSLNTYIYAHRRGH